MPSDRRRFRANRELHLESLEGRLLMAAGLDEICVQSAVMANSSGEGEMGPSLPMDPDASHISLPGEMIPNFAASPTVASISSGNWSDVAIWSTGEVPTAGAIVRISPQTTVTFDIQSDTALNAVGVAPLAKLSFATDVSTRMVVGNLIVFEGGELQIGTPEDPVEASATAEIVIADRDLDLVNDPEQFGTGLLGFGKVTIHGSAKSRTWVRLAEEPRAGDTQIQLEQQVTGWNPGDVIVIPDTRQVTNAEVSRRKGEFAEDRDESIEIVAVDGNTLTLSRPLDFDHLGARDEEGVLKYLPHVALLDRNVVVRSENPEGTRGHVLFAKRADVDIRYARFSQLGRTDAFENIDDTVFRTTVVDEATGQEYHLKITRGNIDLKVNHLPDEWSIQYSDDTLTVHDEMGDPLTAEILRQSTTSDGMTTLLVKIAGQNYDLLVIDGTLQNAWTPLPKKWSAEILNGQILVRDKLENPVPVVELDRHLLRVGTNQVSRYALHMHHVAGARNENNEGYQFKWIGNTVDAAKRWGYVLHGTSYGLIRDNVAYQVQGAGFVTEDGSEIENEFIDNFAMQINGTGRDGPAPGLKNHRDFARGGSGFWFRRSGNTVSGNVVANTTYGGYVMTSYYLGEARVPAFRGAMKRMPGQGVDLMTNPPGVFDNNEAYSVDRFGIWSAWTSGSTLEGMNQPIVFSRSSLWHIDQTAIKFYHTNNIHITDTDILFDATASTTFRNSQPDWNRGATGIDVTAYENHNLVIQNVNIAGGLVGIGFGSVTDPEHPSRILNSNLDNYRNIEIFHPRSDASRGLEIRDVVFDNIADADGSQHNIFMNDELSSRSKPHANQILQVFNYDGVEGNDFRLYYREQHPDFVDPTIGSTNAENFETMGRAFGGQIATSLQEVEGVWGYVDTIQRPIPNFKRVDATATDNSVTFSIETDIRTDVLIQYRESRDPNAGDAFSQWKQARTRGNEVTLEGLDADTSYSGTIILRAKHDVVRTLKFKIRTAETGDEDRTYVIFQSSASTDAVMSSSLGDVLG